MPTPDLSSPPATTTTSPKSRIRVGVVDDHSMMREGIRVFLENLPDFEHAWSAENSTVAMKRLQGDVPDILIVDITLPDRHGIEFVKEAVAVFPSLPVLILSMHDERLYAQRALKAGAKGYLMKNAPPHILEKALRRVASGGYWLNQNVADEILAAFSKSDVMHSEGLLSNLTDREVEIFHLVGEGKATAEIAESLHISPKTVDVHRTNIRTKLQIPDGAGLTRFAIRWVEAHRASTETPSNPEEGLGE
jgi:DNA-binding NarL/FixJ family response regulator